VENKNFTLEGETVVHPYLLADPLSSVGSTEHLFLPMVVVRAFLLRDVMSGTTGLKVSLLRVII
jgi:hypothetical protein